MADRIGCLLVMAVWSFLIFDPGTSGAGEEFVRANIGVQVLHGSQDFRATSRQRIQKGDALRIFIQPEKAGFVYVIHTDGKAVNLLARNIWESSGETMILPSRTSGYAVDGTSNREIITIVVSPGELPELAEIQSGGMTCSRWTALEKALADRSRIDLSETSESSFSIAGTVRGTEDDFFRHLRMYSGKGLLVKRYAFTVKKQTSS